MIGQKISKKTGFIYSALSVMLLVLLYTGMSYRQHQKNANDRTIPSWIQLGHGVRYLIEKPEVSLSDEADLLAIALAGTGMENTQVEEKKTGFLENRILWEASKATLSRLFAGLAMGMFLGVVAGVLMGCYLKIDAAISPLMFFFSRIIPTAAMPIFFKLAGIDMEMYVAMIAFGSMPIVTLSISQYVQNYPNELRYKAYTLGASHAEVITTAIFPGVLPKILDLAVLMIGPALVYLIAAEQIVAGEGFGYRIRVLTKATRFEAVYPLIVVLTVYAGMITFSLKFLQRKLCPWYGLEGR
jgi:NitT/TauT family transport system permease protein